MTTARTFGFIPAIDLPARLLLARNAAGMTQTQLAKVAGISRATIANYEAGKSPRRSAVLAWAMATGVDPTWLLTGEAPSPDGDGASVVRPKGFEPLTSCSAHYLGLTSTFSSAA